MYRREHQVELEPKQIETEGVISYIISNQYFTVWYKYWCINKAEYYYYYKFTPLKTLSQTSLIILITYFLFHKIM